MRGFVRLLVLLGSLAFAPAAFAHASLVKAEPADGAMMADAPAALRLNFNEPVTPLVIRLIGPSGAGKSTVLSLVARLYDPDSGAVLIDGRDVREYRLRSVREQISLVLQDTLLFSGSVKENVAFGRPILVNDMFEHAYHMDFGSNAAAYVDAFMQNVNWEEANRRFEEARKLAASIRG